MMVVPVEISLTAGEVFFVVPLTWLVISGVNSVHLPLTTPPGAEPHVKLSVLGSKLQTLFVNDATALVSTSSKSVSPCT